MSKRTVVTRSLTKHGKNPQIIKSLALSMSSVPVFYPWALDEFQLFQNNLKSILKSMSSIKPIQSSLFIEGLIKVLTIDQNVSRAVWPREDWNRDGKDQRLRGGGTSTPLIWSKVKGIDSRKPYRSSVTLDLFAYHILHWLWNLKVVVKQVVLILFAKMFMYCLTFKPLNEM